MSKIEVELQHQLTGHKSGIFALKQIDDNRFISGDGGGNAVLWNIEEPELATLVASVPSNIFSIEYFNKEQVVVVGTMSGDIHFLNKQNKKQVSLGQHHTKGVFALIIIDGLLVAASGDGRLSIWDCNTFKLIDSFQISKESLRCLQFNEVANKLYIGSSDHSIHYFDWKKKELIGSLVAHSNSVFTYEAISENISISGGRDAHLKIWNKDILIHSIPAHMYTVNHIKSILKDEYFATASRDKSIKFWKAENYDLVKVIENTKTRSHKASVNKLLWLPKSEHLISASDDRSLIVWKVSTSEA